MKRICFILLFAGLLHAQATKPFMGMRYGLGSPTGHVGVLAGFQTETFAPFVFVDFGTCGYCFLLTAGAGASYDYNKKYYLGGSLGYTKGASLGGDLSGISYAIAFGKHLSQRLKLELGVDYLHQVGPVFFGGRLRYQYLGGGS